MVMQLIHSTDMEVCGKIEESKQCYVYIYIYLNIYTYIIYRYTHTHTHCTTGSHMRSLRQRMSDRNAHCNMICVS